MNRLPPILQKWFCTTTVLSSKFTDRLLENLNCSVQRLGMGAKFTDSDIEYIRNYFLWSVKYYPNRTRGQVLEKIHEKVSHETLFGQRFVNRPLFGYLDAVPLRSLGNSIHAKAPGVLCGV